MPAAIPTRAQLRTMKSLDDVVLWNRDRKVQHKLELGMNLFADPRRTGPEWLKLHIRAIHRSDKGIHYFTCVRWYERERDMKKLGLTVGEGNVLLTDCLGITELVATDEEVIVPQSDFVERLYVNDLNVGGHGPMIKMFDPGDGAWWYTRGYRVDNVKTGPVLQDPFLQCICQEPYKPDSSQQRFCEKCKAWFDEACIERHAAPARLKGTPREMLNHFPIARGAGISKQNPQDWMIAGTGEVVGTIKNALEMLKKQEKKKTTELDVKQEWNEWEIRLKLAHFRHLDAAAFIRFVKTTKLGVFKCPQCAAHI